MGHKYTREHILGGAVELALAEGVGSLTFGRLAKRMGTSDRVVVYYFPSKTTLVSEVLVEIGNQLQAVLAKAFTEPAAGHLQLAKAAYGVLARDDTDAIFAVYFESCGLAAAGAQPFQDLAAALFEWLVGWLSGFFRGNPKQRRAEAEAAARRINASAVVNAQIHAWGRGKGGGVKIAKDAKGRDVGACSILSKVSFVQ